MKPKYLAAPIKHRDKDTIGIFLETTKHGFLKGVYFVADTDQDVITLQLFLKRITLPNHFGWIRRLFSGE